VIPVEAIIKQLTDYALKNSLRLFKEMEGNLHPYGIVMDQDGNTIPFYDPYEEEFPDSGEVLAGLRNALYDHMDRYDYRGSALCYMASKMMNGIEYDLLVLEFFFSDRSLHYMHWHVIEIHDDNHTFTVHDKIDYYAEQ